MNKEIGFVFLAKRISDAIEEFSDRDEGSLKEDLQIDISIEMNYDNDLHAIGVSKEQFFDTSDLVRYLFLESIVERAQLIEYSIYKKYSLMFSKYWFLKPSFFLSYANTKKLLRLSTFFEQFLENSSNVAIHVPFLSEVDLNYDYFSVENKFANQLLEDFSKIALINGLFVDKNRTIEVLIKRWR